MILYDRRFAAAAAVALVAAAAAFGVSPPEGLDSSRAFAMRGFAALASAALVAVAIAPGLVWRTAWSRSAWVGLAAAAFVLGLAAYAYAGSVDRACTARYDGRNRIIGTELTPLGQAYVADNPTLSRDELLFDAAGVAERVWTRASIDRCRTLVGATYFLFVPGLLVSLFAAARSVPAGALSARASRRARPAEAPRDAEFRYDAFISYRHGSADATFARELLSALEQRGYAVAIDERDFPANASFLREMERCIRESRYTLAVISPRYLGSGHCEEEAVLCKVLDMSDRRRRLIPLIIEPVSLPAWLFGIVGIDWTAHDPLIDPLDRLLATLGPPLAVSG